MTETTRDYRKGPAYGPERFDHYVLQAFFPGELGWSDINTADTLEKALMMRDRRKRTEPDMQYRLQSVSSHGRRRAVRISMSHLHSND